MTKRVSVGLIGFATIILFFSFVVYCAYAYNLITFPFDYDQGEGFELVDTIMFSEFRYPYQNTEAYPYYSSNYPPLFHILAVPFVWLFGNAYWYGRLLGFVGTLISAGLIGYAVYRDGNVRWVAIFSGLAFLASNTIYHIGPLLRQHMTMVLFELMAIIIIARAFPSQNRRGIATGLLMLVAAGYTKQLAAITALAVIVWMILRNPKRGIIWSAIFAAVGLGIFAWLTFDTNGEWWRQAIVANVNQFNPFQTFDLSILWWQLHGLLIIPAVLMALYEIYVERMSLYTIWFVFAVVLGAIGSGTWGAGDSYFATAIAAMCILSGIFFSRWIRGDFTLPEHNPYSIFLKPLGTKWFIQSALVIVPLIYIGYGITTLKMPAEGAFFGTVADILRIEPNVMGRHYDSASYDVLGYANIGHFVTQEDHDAGWQIVELINASEQPVMSEEAGFSLAAGRDVITNPTQLRNLYLAGLWEGSEILADLEAQRFGLIILRAQFYPTPMLEVMGQHYGITQTIRMNGFEYLILEPT